jgi:hypothetical protein
MYILVPEESGEVKTNTYYAGGSPEWQGKDECKGAKSKAKPI